MKRVLKWFLLAMAVAVVIAAVLAAAYLMDWPLRRVAAWTGAAALLLFAAWAVGRIWAYYRRARAEAREAASEGSGKRIAEARKELEARWKAFLQPVRSARAEGKGDPLYSLPWLLVLGEEGAGAATALENSRTAVSSADADGRTAGPESLGWRILEQEVAIDPPARYVFHRDEVDAAEWGHFLGLLLRTRPREPLNGVVVALPADALLRGGEQKLKDQAVALEKRMEELIRKLGVSVPVYLLVTKCDLVGGMTRFFGAFPEDSSLQAMGGLNDERSAEKQPGAFLDEVFGQVAQRLAELRLTLLGDLKPEEVHPQAVIFPEEFRELRGPLGRFVDVLFEKHPYREPFFLRGLYFSSARQEGVPESAYLGRVGLREEQIAVDPGEKSYFLKDLFGRILPGDRSLVAATASALGWQRLTRNAGFLAWGALCLGIGAVLSVSFSRNLGSIRQAGGSVPPSKVGAEVDANLGQVDQLRSAVLESRRQHKEWWLPTLGLTQSEQLEGRLKAAYVDRFRRGVLEPLDKELDKGLQAAAESQDASSIARYVDHLSRRVTLSQLAAEGRTSDDALGKPEDQPDFGLLHPADVEVVQRDYRSYLEWAGVPASAEEAKAQQARLASLLSKKNIGFAWLVDWANMQQSVEAVTLAPYWGAEPATKSGERLVIDRAYTPKGWESIAAVVETIKRSTEQEGVSEALGRFQEEYRSTYFSQWERFLKGFSRGQEVWAGREKRLELASRLGAPESPYSRILAACPDSLSPAVTLSKSADDLPPWVPLVYRYDRLNRPDYGKLMKSGEGIVGQIAAKGGKVLVDLKAKLRGEAEQPNVIEQDLKAHPYLVAYQETLKQMAAQAQSPQTAYKLARDTFVESEASVGEPQQPVGKNFWVQAKLRATLSQGNPREDVFWQLLAGPAEQLWGTLLRESEAHLGRLWDEEVLAEAKNLRGWELLETLQGDNGKVWGFLDKNLAPFLARDSQRGYTPKKLYKDSLNVSVKFLKTAGLGKPGAKAFNKPYRVSISAIPTAVNPGATVHPHKTRLLLQCGTENQEFENLNFPREKSFTWSAQDCSDVVLEISAGDAVLTKRYTGYDAFIQFLGEFKSGSRTFRRDEFPQEQSKLAQYNIQSITVSYGFKGQSEILGLTRYDAAAVPKKLFE